jgi:hypothetical protein
MCFKSPTIYSPYPLDTVLFSYNYFMNAPIYANDWVQFTLTKPFYYNGVSNFIVDIKPGTLSQTTNFLYSQSFTNPNLSCGRSQAHNPQSTIHVYKDIFLIGFDITPTIVRNISRYSDVQLYPNPANERVTLSLVCQSKIKDLTVSISNTTGSLISKENYQDITGTFSQHLDLRGVPKGLYFIEINGDKEKLAKKVIIQ